MKSIDDLRCCHCGQPHKKGLEYSITVSGEARTMCCPGCQAVATLIEGCRKVSNVEKRDIR